MKYTSYINMSDFPKTLNIPVWEEYLGRELTLQECSLFENCKSEKNFNKRVQALHIIAESRGLYIPALTPLHGNCLFESISYLGYGIDHELLRKGTAMLMLLLRNTKNLFHGQSESLNDLFGLTNEITTVISRDSCTIYKYNYDIMCFDIASPYSWSRLPTQLVLMVLSLILNVEFIIISDSGNGYDPKINVNNENDMNTQRIFLGHIGETHYVPLAPRTGNPKEEKYIKYDEAKKDFMEWAIITSQSVNEYLNIKTNDEQPSKTLKIYENPIEKFQCPDDNSQPPDFVSF